MATVALKKLTKRYGKVEVLHGIDLDIADGEFVVLVGPSGCGKSTTLRMIAGLETITRGDLLIGERRVNEVDPKDRDLAFVFQNYALFPHMTVAGNLAFGMRLRGVPKATIQSRIAEATALLGLDGLLQRKPKELSGGQRQRVALGRALLRDPVAFLLDEPLSNLDAKLRAQMRTELVKLHRRVGRTIIHVTHDQVEAMTMGDRLCIMNGGRIVQVGRPMDVYRNPADTFVAGFLASPPMNLIEGRIENERIVVQGLELPLAGFAPKSADIVLGIRPEDLAAVAMGPTAVPVDLDVVAIEALGPELVVIGGLGAGGAEIAARLSPDFVAAIDAPCRLWLDPARIALFDAATTRAVARS